MSIGGFFKKVGKVVSAPVVYPVKAIKQGVEKTMFAAIKNSIYGIIRTVLAVAFGALIQGGSMTTGQLDELAGFIGGAIILLWSVWEKAKAAKAEQ